jgi:YbbR domain-containing protein
MRKLIFDNLGLKIAAVLLAMVLWIFVTSRGQSEMSIDVPLEFKNIPSGFEMVSHSTNTVALSIKGQERLIKNVKPSDVRVFVDLSKAKRGDGTYYINREDIKLPHAITITSVDPASVKVITEETATKTVRVLPVIIGEPGKGFYSKSVESVPQYLVIEGTRSEVFKINTIKTEPLDITGYRESLSQDMKIDLTGKNIRSNVKEVTVKVIIGARKR